MKTLQISLEKEQKISDYISEKLGRDDWDTADNSVTLAMLIEDIQEIKKQLNMNKPRKAKEEKPIRTQGRPRLAVTKRPRKARKAPNVKYDKRGVTHYFCAKCNSACKKGEILCKRCKGELK